MKALHCIAFVLVVIGGINWGLIGISGFVEAGSNWNVVSRVLGSWPVLEWIVYVLVGVSAIVLAFGHKKDCKTCTTSPSPMAM